jgi:hypothetical protein
MARKGDIDSKSVAARVPMNIYLNLLQKSSSNKKTLSSYLCDILSNESLNKYTTSETEEVLNIKMLEIQSLLKEKESQNEYLRNLVREYKKGYNEEVLSEKEFEIKSLKESLKEYKKKYNEETFSLLKNELRDKTFQVEQQKTLMIAKEEYNEKLEGELRQLKTGERIRNH